jgi:hypothetical protein
MNKNGMGCQKLDQESTKASRTKKLTDGFP